MEKSFTFIEGKSLISSATESPPICCQLQMRHCTNIPVGISASFATGVLVYKPLLYQIKRLTQNLKASVSIFLAVSITDIREISEGDFLWLLRIFNAALTPISCITTTLAWEN